jgi:hypothetical protein
MGTLRDAVEATLVGRDHRLVERCDVDGILTALDLYGIYDVEVLVENLQTSFAAMPKLNSFVAASSSLQTQP